MSTALAVAAPAVTGEEMDLIRRTVANGATDAELKLFLFDCQRRGVHPLDKLIHFTKRGGRYTPVTSIDFMRSQAAMTGEMAGSEDPIFLTEDNKAHPLAATVTVYRITQGQRYPYAATARWSEYCPDNAPMWRKMPHTMLGKCAEALALRKAFPQQLAGLYSREEMDQAEEKPPVVSAAPKLVVEKDVQVAGNAHEKPPSAIEADVVVDVETGEQKPPAPAGFYYIGSYSYRNGWHEAQLLKWDAQGGPLKVSTKKACGHLLEQAHANGLPVQVKTSRKPNSVGEAYADDVKVYRTEPEPDLSGMLPATDIAF